MVFSLSQLLGMVLLMAVIYYVLGVLVSTLTKYFLDILNMRGKTLESFLRKNLLGTTVPGNEDLLTRLKNTPQINALKPVRYTNAGFGFFTGKTEIINIIERIDSKILVDALFDLAGSQTNVKQKAKAIIELLPDQLPGPNGPVDFIAKKNLKLYIDEQIIDLVELREKMETWFNGVLDQASQEFKAQARRFVVLISAIITFALGIDSIELVNNYWINTTTIKTANTQADLIIQSEIQGTTMEYAALQNLVSRLEEMQTIDFNWYKKPEDASESWFLIKFLGLLITLFAISQGSSFWYDLIKQLKGEQTNTTNKAQTSPEWSVRSVNINWHH